MWLCGTEKYKVAQWRFKALMMRSMQRASSEASCTLTTSGSLDVRNGIREDIIGGAIPSIQNSGFRRIIFDWEFLLFFREELDCPLLDALLESSSTGR